MNVLIRKILKFLAVDSTTCQLKYFWNFFESPLSII
jgi:hypothetical protein